MRTTSVEPVSALFAGSGELPTLVCALDWRATPLGSFESWPDALRSATRICLDATTIPMAIWAGRDLTLIYNDPYAAVLGPDKHPWALGRAARDVWPERWDRCGPELRQVMEFGKCVQCQDERFWLLSEGREEEAFFSYTFTPIRDEQGCIVAALNVLQETTERVRASEARLKFAQEAAGAGMWHWDLVTGEVEWSDQLYRLFGWDPKTTPPVTLDAWRAALHPDDRVRAETDLMRALADGAPLASEDRIVLPSGEVRWVNALGRTTYDADGKPLYVSGICLDITERKRAAGALAESEERFRTLADNIAQFAWMADETGSIVWFNKRWYDYTGTTPEDTQGWGWQKVHHPAHVDRVLDKIRRCFAAGASWEDTFPLRGKDGTYRWFLSRAIPIRNESGQVVRWFGTNTDITEQRAAEEALRVSERRYRTLAENAPEAIARFDRELRYTYVNDYGARLYGLSAGDMLGKTVPELGMAGARAAFCQEQCQQVAASRTHRSIDFEFESPVFGRQYLSTMLVPEPGEDFSILAITHDVTRLKRAEKRVRESEARFRRLADAMPQLVWTARPDGTIDYYNQRTAELSGCERRDDGTVTWEGVVHAEDLASTLEAWQRALREGTTYEVTHRLQRADGATHWYLTRAIPVRDDDGRVVQWFGTTTDVDAQKRTEEALREADRQKNEFLAMLSHDLRNPLAAIRASLALLEQAGADSPQGARALTVLGRQVNQTSRMLDDLLDMTRIAKGKLLLKREPVELNAVVRAIGEDHAELFERERIDFQVIVAPRPLGARADSARLTQAIGNLLQNAAKFTPEGGRVTLSLSATDGDALIEVSDNGAGIQPELLGRLFDPLVQAQRTLNQSRGGLGLGLALVKGIVHLHGGSVAAASEGPGRGAVFTIRLPLERGA